MANKRAKRFNKIDEEVEETFPASDPPAFMAGSIGAPPRRKTVKKAAKKPARNPAKGKVSKATKRKKKRK